MVFNKGDYVLVRSRGAGVHSGILQNLDESTVELTESRRLWHWICSQGDFLSGVATYGLSNRSKVGAQVERIYITEVCEVIAVTDIAEKSIRNVVTHRG